MVALEDVEPEPWGTEASSKAKLKARTRKCKYPGPASWTVDVSKLAKKFIRVFPYHLTNFLANSDLGLGTSFLRVGDPLNISGTRNK